MSAVFEWHERGAAFELLLHPGSLVEVALRDGRGWRSVVELPLVAVHELREALVEAIGDPQRAELLEAMHASEAALGDTERARDEALERVTQLEAELRARLADLEAARTALDLADRRAREAEAELDGRYPTVARVRS